MRSHLAVLIALLVGLIAVSIYERTLGIEKTWLLSAGMIGLFIIIVGNAVTGRPAGALIDARNKVSLSQLQVVVWSVVVLATVLAVSLHNAASVSAASAFNFEVPQGLLVVMGISVASSVASPAIKASAAKAPTLHRNDNAGQAQWRDLFRAEEEGLGGQFDIGKVQMFFFTFVVVAGYMSAIKHQFAAAGDIISSLPPISEGMNMLLGISHTGYLAKKLVTPHGPGGNP